MSGQVEIPIKRALCVLAISLLAAPIPFGVGCGGNAGSGSDRAVKWSVDRQLGPKRARLSAVVRPCNYEPPFLEEPIVEYDGDRVEIELRQTPETLKEGQNGCFLSLLTAHTVVIFERDLDELVLYDLSTDPPEKRWPREKR